MFLQSSPCIVAWFHKSFSEEAWTGEVAREGVRTGSIFSLTVSQHCFKQRQILVAIIMGIFHPYLSYTLCVLPSQICLLHVVQSEGWQWWWAHFTQTNKLLNNGLLGKHIFLIGMAEIMDLEQSVRLSVAAYFVNFCILHPSIYAAPIGPSLTQKSTLKD